MRTKGLEHVYMYPCVHILDCLSLPIVSCMCLDVVPTDHASTCVRT